MIAVIIIKIHGINPVKMPIFFNISSNNRLMIDCCCGCIQNVQNFSCNFLKQKNILSILIDVKKCRQQNGKVSNVHIYLNYSSIEQTSITK